MPNNNKNTKRLNILLKLEVAQNIEKIAYMKKETMTSVISEALERYIESNQSFIKKHDEVFPVIRSAKTMHSIEVKDGESIFSEVLR